MHEGKTPLICILGTRRKWVATFTLCSVVPEGQPNYPLNMWLGGPQNWSLRSEKKEKKWFFSAGIRMSDFPARSLVTVATKTFYLSKGYCAFFGVFAGRQTDRQTRRSQQSLFAILRIRLKMPTQNFFESLSCYLKSYLLQGAKPFFRIQLFLS